MPVAQMGNLPLQRMDGNPRQCQAGRQGPGSVTEYEATADSSLPLGIYVRTVGQKTGKPLCNGVNPLKSGQPAGRRMMEEGFRTTDYRLIYVTQGEGEAMLRSDESSKKLRSGSLIWLMPGQWYAYTRDKSTDWNEYAINFNGDLIGSLIQGSPLEHGSGIFEVGFISDWVNLYMQAMETARHRKTGHEVHLSGILLHLLGSVLSVLKEREDCQDAMRQKMEKAKILMNENLCSNIDMRQLASMVGLSYSWFRKTFKEYVGVAPARYFSELKIQRVKQMLEHDPNLSIKELIYSFGYTSTDNFYDSFKRFTGYPPGQYRKMIMEKRSA